MITKETEIHCSDWHTAVSFLFALLFQHSTSILTLHFIFLRFDISFFAWKAKLKIQIIIVLFPHFAGLP